MSNVCPYESWVDEKIIKEPTIWQAANLRHTVYFSTQIL